MKILYVGPAIPEYLAALKSLVRDGDALESLPRFVPEERATIESADVLLVLAPVTAETLAMAGKTRLIQVLGAGYDSVDVEAATRAGIPVASTGGANAASVAEHTMALLLSTWRRVAEADRRMRNGDWAQLQMYRGGIYELAGKTLGLVGFGRIGQAVARMARGFDVKMLYYARRRLDVEQEQALGVCYAPLEDLLRQSDVVTVQVPLSAETVNLIGREELALMKPSAVLINTARGAVVDEAALTEALVEGRLAGAGLDVFVKEPIDPSNPLLTLDRTVLSPHIAGAAEEAVQRNFRACFDNIARLAAGQPLLNQVNVVG